MLFYQKIKQMFSDINFIENEDFHIPFLRNILNNPLHQNVVVDNERGRHCAPETGYSTQEI